MLVDVEGMSRFGAMLANNGINPSTGERIVEPETVKATVTLMQTCGMYNGAGKFTKDHGVPTKSGVSGGLMTVIPGIGAFATWSPPLNEEETKVLGQSMEETLRKTSEEGVPARVRKAEAAPSKKEVEDHNLDHAVSRNFASALREGLRGGVRAQEERR